MKLLNKIKGEILKIPKPIRIFALKALIIFIIWQSVYSLVLLPNRYADKPLSVFTGKATAQVLNWSMGGEKVYVKEVLQSETIEGVTLVYEKATLYKGNKKVIGIGDGCNGLSLYILFVGFIIAYPGTIKTKIWYSLLGLVLIVIVNILRCAGLAYLIQKHPSFTPFAHHYLYKIITYALVFLLWARFVKLQQKKSISNA